MRIVNRNDPLQAVALGAVETLRDRGEGPMCVAPQNLIEFRNGATRPAALNGLGLPPDEAAKLLDQRESMFTLLVETPEIYPAWKALVSGASVLGKQVHDARLVAVCQVHRVMKVLTLNVRHFARFTSIVTGLSVLDPLTI